MKYSLAKWKQHHRHAFLGVLTILLIIFNLNCVALAFSPAPEGKPELTMADAIKIATAHSKTNKDIADYYMDRVWIGRLQNENRRVWIVSWSPNGNDRKPGQGWFFVTVDMEGVAKTGGKGIAWLDDATIEAIRLSK
jgi:hypothetical protein